MFDANGIPLLVKQFLGLGKVDSDTRKSSLSTIQVYNTCVKPDRCLINV